MSIVSQPVSTGKLPQRDLHFNYDLQVWIVAGLVDQCCHPDRMRPNCCNADRFAGLSESDAIAKHAKIGDAWAPKVEG
jgi:hypothetical protein